MTLIFDDETYLYNSLFEAPEDFRMVQCISADAKMGAGLAKETCERFPEVEDFRRRYDLETGMTSCHMTVPSVASVGQHLLLVTKRDYWGKPGYAGLVRALQYLKEAVVKMGWNKLAIPHLGCGLDKLRWETVKELIIDIFQDTDVEIRVYGNKEKLIKLD